LRVAAPIMVQPLFYGMVTVRGIVMDWVAVVEAPWGVAMTVKV
jgi:hypothetical protein